MSKWRFHNPLSIVQRQSYRETDHLSAANLVGDINEDDAWEDEESEDFSSSSRNTSSSHEPMLSKYGTPKHAASAYAGKFARRKCNRYFTVLLGGFLVLFILTLVRLSYISNQQAIAAIEQEIPIAPEEPRPPPVHDSLPFLKRYYGGLRTLVSRSQNTPEYPTQQDKGAPPPNAEVPNDVPSRRQISPQTIPSMKPFDPLRTLVIPTTSIQDCFLDANSRIPVPQLHSFDGVPQGFPDNAMGSYKIFELRDDVCFDRFGRWGPYGLGYSADAGGTGAGMRGEREGYEGAWSTNGPVDYRNIRWADAQERCAKANDVRFKTPLMADNIPINAPLPASITAVPILEEPLKTSQSDNKLSRAAVIIRTWGDYDFDAEDIMNVRALISELSLASGTEYVVHFLIHIKNHDLPIWTNATEYERVVDEALPEEFRGMGTLWSEDQMSKVYPGLEETNYRDLPVYGSYRSTYLPVQWFAHNHPEYDFFWHWEMDIRYIGHYYHLFDRVGAFAKSQPRKGLWERNARFYIPSEHGSWEDFRQMIRNEIEAGTSNNPALVGAGTAIEKPIWGPNPPEGNDIDLEASPAPPTSYENDKYQWGVGEHADFITFNPLFNPDDTGWILAEDVTGYNKKAGLPPRRTAIITASRLSRRLLETMHNETAFKNHTMFSEMWPGSCALHHGLKAVYAPHPEYVDHRWPTRLLESTFNGGRNGASGGSRTSVFEDTHQINFLGTTWYYHALFPIDLYRRWLGFKVNGEGGEQWEMAEEGRMCLPSMLLHPIKQIDLDYEQVDEATNV